ncbi:MAG: EamA family transporter [Promethearchaeota archaeon]
MSVLQFKIETFAIIITLMTIYGILGGVSAVLSKKGILKIGGLKIEKSWKKFFQTFMKLVSTPVWFIGAILGILGFCVYLIALQNFELSIVKPLVNTNLVFTFILAYLFFKEQLKWSEWLGIVSIILGMIFLGIVTRESSGEIELIPLFSMLPLIVIGVVLLGILVITERIHNQEFIYSISAGVFYGMGAIFSKAILVLLTLNTSLALLFSITIMFSLTYIVAIVSQQFAFNNGRLSIVSPLTNSISVLIPVIGAIIIFNEQIYFEKILGFLSILLGIILLRRTILSRNHSISYGIFP